MSLKKVGGRYSHNFGRFFNDKYLKQIGLKNGGGTCVIRFV